MIKTGITTLQQLLHSADKTLFRKDLKHISITLYDTIIDKPNADSLAERILLLFADEEGAYKRTYSNRFELFDQQIVKIIQEQLNNQENVTIQDVGVSDARTSVDFFNRLVLLFPRLTLCASDYNPKVYIIEEGKTKITIGPTDKILEITWPPFVFNTIKRDSYRHYPINHVIRKLVEWFVIPSLMKAYTKGKIKAKDMFLYCPSALELAKRTQQFQLMQHNLFDPFQEQSDIIRAMNVLNASYFSKENLIQIIKNIYGGLYKGGLFITGSNQDVGSLLHGGVYQKTPQGFIKIWQSGEGSPIESEILSYFASGKKVRGNSVI